MSAQRQASQVSREKQQSASHAPETAKPEGLAPQVDGASFSGGAVGAQVSRLTQMPGAQRKIMMSRINQTQGNHHAARVAGAYQVARQPIIQRFGEEGHSEADKGGVEGVSEAEIKDIEFGNWLTDMNQISLIKGPLSSVGINLGQEELAAIVSVMAEDKFGPTIGRGLNKDRMGEYKTSEHFDNPNNAKDSQKAIEDRKKAVPSFIQEGFDEIDANFNKALKAGRTSVGREYYGRALHIMEDYFAHSNFIEIALSLRGKPTDTQAGKVFDQSEGKERYQLTSGIFNMADTALSMLKLVAGAMSKPPKPGEKRAASDRIALILLSRKSPRMAGYYEKYLEISEAISKKIKSWVPGYEWLAEKAGQAKSFVTGQIASLINKLAKVAAPNLTGKNPVVGKGSEYTSHSLLNKDDAASNKNFKLALALATHVVRNVNPKMLTAWKDPLAKDDLFKEIHRYMQHPDKDSWWWPYVDSYIKTGVARGDYKQELPTVDDNKKKPNQGGNKPTPKVTGSTYVVQKGDSLSKIAKREYGNANLWPQIYEANRDKINNPDLIYPDQKLVIPPKK